MKLIFPLALMLLFSCANDDNAAPTIRESELVGTTISIASSYKCDLERGVYTIYFFTKPPLEVRFQLSKEEKETITTKLVALKLTNDDHLLHLKDDCSIMPKMFDTLRVTTRTSIKEVTIDVACDDFESSGAGKVKAFILYVTDLIRTKPEVKSAPESDKFYL